MNPLDLPDIFTSDLSPDDVLRLLRDVRAQTEVLGLTFKGGAVTYASTEDTGETGSSLDTIDTKLSALITTLAMPAETPIPAALPHGVQLRYAFGGVVFYDTLIRRGDHWRLTRIAPPHAQPG
jgi:hypothetical protein